MKSSTFVQGWVLQIHCPLRTKKSSKNRHIIYARFLHKIIPLHKKVKHVLNLTLNFCTGSNKSAIATNSAAAIRPVIFTTAQCDCSTNSIISRCTHISCHNSISWGSDFSRVLSKYKTVKNINILEQIS